jgi:hypothetical protein
VNWLPAVLHPTLPAARTVARVLLAFAVWTVVLTMGFDVFDIASAVSNFFCFFSPGMISLLISSCF